MKVCAEGAWYRATVVEHRPDISIVMVQLDSGENINVWPKDVNLPERVSNCCGAEMIIANGKEGTEMA